MQDLVKKKYIMFAASKITEEAVYPTTQGDTTITTGINNLIP